MKALSSNGFSSDLQLQDAMTYLKNEHPDNYAEILQRFPQWDYVQWEGAWIDYHATKVDPEWSSWLIDAIEDTGFVLWEEGEPWST